MPTIIIDENALALLLRTGTLTEIRGPSGTLVGFFAPSSLEKASQYVQAAARTSPVELQQSYQQGEKRYSTREVLAQLESREKA